MELIAKISKGTIMDQIYIPKKRMGLDIGSLVLIRPLKYEKPIEKHYFYNIKSIEPLKLELVNTIISTIEEKTDNENIIISGSFLEKGFSFNDIDIIIVREGEICNPKIIKDTLKERIGVEFHLVILDNKSLIRGLQTDPLYQMMLSRCISKKRILYKVKNEINYKLLDLHLLKSELLVDNFDHLNGNEKYYLIRISISILLFLKHQKIDKKVVDNEIKKIFSLKSVEEIKQNMLDKNKFLGKYKVIHRQIFKDIIDGIKNGPKQK